MRYYFISIASSFRTVMKVGRWTSITDPKEKNGWNTINARKDGKSNYVDTAIFGVFQPDFEIGREHRTIHCRAITKQEQSFE